MLGCDGANSLVRAAIGATMRDLKFEQRWLVVDVATDADLGQWEGVHQVCDPDRAGDVHAHRRRPATAGSSGCRPARPPTTSATSPALHPLIAPWTDDIPLERAGDRCGWPSTRSAPRSPTGGGTGGSSCSATPPTSPRRSSARAWAPALRDAANLAWKLAGVLAGEPARTRVLDTYQAERKPHARAMIRLAKLVGTAMTAGGELGKLLAPRGRAAAAPPARRSSGTSWTAGHRRCARSALVRRPRLRRSLAGRLCPNALARRTAAASTTWPRAVRPGHTTMPSPAQQAEIERRGAVVVPAHPGSQLHRWLRRGHARAAVVRPDGTVLRAGRDLSALCAALPAFAADPGHVTSIPRGSGVDAGRPDLSSPRSRVEMPLRV